MVSIAPISFLFAAFVVLAALFITQSQREWRTKTLGLFSKLGAIYCPEASKAENGKVHVTEEEIDPWHKVSDKIPPVVDRYLRSAMPNHGVNPRRIRALRIEQTGVFRLNDKWIPFNATQLFSAATPGFLWDATMRMESPISLFSVNINVRDLYIDGKGLMEGKLMGVFPVVRVEDTPELNEGELMRWLAEAVLFPTALLPNHEDGLEWTMTEQNAVTSTTKVTITDPESETKATLDIKFDASNNMISSIHGMRHMAVGDKFVLAPWEGRFYDYKLRGDFVVPTRMEVGWWVDDELALYFKGNNTKYEYEYC